MNDSTRQKGRIAVLTAALAAVVGLLPLLAQAQIGAEQGAKEISGVRSRFTGTVPEHAIVVLTLEAR